MGRVFITAQTRLDYWNYLTGEKVERPKGVTDRRLEKVKDAILADMYFWDQVILRFGGEFMTPVEFYQQNSFGSEQSRANFWAMVRERIVKR